MLRGEPPDPFTTPPPVKGSALFPGHVQYQPDIMASMPAPLGQESRDKNFLLRMTGDENEFVRSLARMKKTSLNDAITGLIRDAMARADAARARMTSERTPPPDPPTPPAKPGRRRGGHVNPVKLTFSDLGPPPEQIPGQPDITDPDQ